MSVSKEQMLEWIGIWRRHAECENEEAEPQDDFCHSCFAIRTSDKPGRYTNQECQETYEAIRALIENSGPGPSSSGRIPGREPGEAGSTPAGPSIFAPSLGPNLHPEPNDDIVGQPGNMTDEEALGKLESIITGWSFHAGFPSGEGLVALAHIRAALKPKRVSREWMENRVRTLEDFLDTAVPSYESMGLTWPLQNMLIDWLRELGVEVEEEKP
jgi:hypothetical protein